MLIYASIWTDSNPLEAILTPPNRLMSTPFFRGSQKYRLKPILKVKQMSDLQEKIAKELFGKQIREIRDAEGLTRSQVEIICGINASTLKGIELGNHYPSFDILLRFISDEYFSKYVVWLMVDLVDLDNNPSKLAQISPKQKLAQDLGIVQKAPPPIPDRLATAIDGLTDFEIDQIAEYAEFIKGRTR